MKISMKLLIPKLMVVLSIMALLSGYSFRKNWLMELL
jgi:hypothetical protein